jgi:CubicO group peptidase (beta-lactamase class C family)
MKWFVLASALFVAGCQSLFLREDVVKSKQEILSGISVLESDIQSQMRKYRVEKASLAIVCGNQLIYTGAFGASADERFQAASISKAVSTYGSLKLMEQGQLALDRPLIDYMASPYIPNLALGGKITLKMVLTHTSGLRNDASGKDRTVYFTPGSVFHYSGCGFAYLQGVIETITKTPFDTYMEDTVLKRLNMSDSVFSIARSDGTKSVSAAYSLVTTPHDLALFFMELMDPKNIDPNLIKLMVTPTVAIDQRYSWGLGIGIQTGGSEDAVWHWGNNNPWRMLAVFYKASRTGAILMMKGDESAKIYAGLIHEAIGGPQYGFENAIPSTDLW